MGRVLLLLTFVLICLVLSDVRENHKKSKFELRRHQCTEFYESIGTALFYFKLGNEYRGYHIGNEFNCFVTRAEVTRGEYDNYPHLKARYIQASIELIKYYTIVTTHKLPVDKSIPNAYRDTCKAIEEEGKYLEKQATELAKRSLQPQLDDIAERMNILKDIPK